MKQDAFVIRIIVALLFAISFTLIGWTAPVLYATHAPQNQFIDVHSFSAQDVSPEASHHYVCFDRTVEKSTSGRIYTELYLVSDSGERVEVGGSTMKRYFQEGRHNVVTPLELPDNLEEGEYKYVLVTELQLADGRVERAFAFKSETFTVDESETANPERSGVKC